MLLIRIINSINHSPLAHPNDPITADRQQLPASIDLEHTHTDREIYMYGICCLYLDWHFTNVRVVLVSLRFRISDVDERFV